MAGPADRRTRLRRAAARRLGRLARRLGDVPPAPVPRVVRAGLVEKFGADRVVGWVAVPKGAPPVRISLKLNGREVAATWATEPTDRTNWGETRPFRFWLKDLWTYTRLEDRLVVAADDVALPIFRFGMYRHPDKAGRSSPWMLKSKMEQGYVFGQKGGLQLSKTRDLDWQAGVLALFEEIRAFVATHLGHELFFSYGTLLGAVRDGGFIGHDLDLDAAYISDCTDGRAAATELRDLGFALIETGYSVESFLTHLHITNAAGTRIDIFHLYFDDDDLLAFPFGIAGTTTIRRDEWKGVTEINFAGARGVVPVLGAEVAEHIYGAGWRTPKPGFMWYLDRTTRAPDGIMPPDMVEEIYWANFYAHTTVGGGSPFAAAISTRADLPETVIDIGCGDGRDSLTFAAVGKQVIGLDRSAVGIRRACAQGAALGADARFVVCDLSDGDRFAAVLADALRPDRPAMFYLRFFLHAVTADVQDLVLKTIAGCARDGDLFAAEFRTDADEAQPKVHDGHYRRFQSGADFSAQLRGHGFEVLEEHEGAGLSPYRGEDPVLYRAVARRCT